MKWNLRVIYTTPFPGDNAFHEFTESHNTHKECQDAFAEIKKLYQRIGYKYFKALITKGVPNVETS